MRATGRQSKTQDVRLGVDVARDFVHEIEWEICEVHGGGKGTENGTEPNGPQSELSQRSTACSYDETGSHCATEVLSRAG